MRENKTHIWSIVGVNSVLARLAVLTLQRHSHSSVLGILTIPTILDNTKKRFCLASSQERGIGGKGNLLTASVVHVTKDTPLWFRGLAALTWPVSRRFAAQPAVLNCLPAPVVEGTRRGRDRACRGKNLEFGCRSTFRIHLACLPLVHAGCNRRQPRSQTAGCWRHDLTETWPTQASATVGCSKKILQTFLSLLPVLFLP